jgi:uncharacterized protein involved in outer membrane biogenesis
MNGYMKKPLIRISIGVLALVAGAFVVSIFFLGSIVKNRIETAGPRVTQVEVKLDSADVWLLPGFAQLHGLFIGNPPGCKTEAAIKVGGISIRMNAMSAFADKVIIDKIIVQSPDITLEGGLKKNNLTRIRKNMDAYVSTDADSSPTATGPAASPAAAGKPGKTYQINDLLITGGRLHINSLFASGKSVTIPLPDIHLANLGAGPTGITAPEVAQKALTGLLSSIASTAADEIPKLGKNAASAAEKFDFQKAGEKLKSLLGQ